MSKEKQIEEMAKVMHDRAHEIAEDPYGLAKILAQGKRMPDDFAEALYTAGYRKASDVAREIFAEIDKEYEVFDDYDEVSIGTLRKDLAELKKKYTEETSNDR